MKVRLTMVNDAEGIFNLQKITWINTYPNEKYGVKRKDIVERFADEESIIAKIKKQIEGYGKYTCGWVVELDGEIIGSSATHKDK